MVDPELSAIVDAALERLQAELEEAAPFLAQQVSGWMAGLGQGSPADYFKHPLGFPMLLVPWWLEKTLNGCPDPAFQTDLVTSSIHGYLAIRLIDNLMDGHATVEMALLPAVAVFHTKFQTTYGRYFAPDHPFWEHFQQVWFESAEATIRDASLHDLGYDEFLAVTAKKTCAAKIPAAAVCYRYERPDLVESWSQFLDRFGAWHQMWNDLVTWRKDLECGTRTYLLSEADRRRGPDQAVSEWVIAEGLVWAFDLLEAWMEDVRLAPAQLNSSDLAAYLEERALMLAARREKIEAGLRTATELLVMFEQA